MLNPRLFAATVLCLLPSLIGSISASLLAQEPPGETEEQAQPMSALGRAMVELEQGRIDNAVSILREAGPEDRSDPRLAALLGAIYAETGRNAEALDLLTPLAESQNADVAVLYNAGRAAAALGENDRAQRYLEASVAAFPASPAARELGLLHARQGRSMPAYLTLKPWCRSNPGDAEAATAAATAAVRLGRGEEAEELLRLLPTEEPRIKLLWANALLLKGDAWSALALAKGLDETAPEELVPQALTLLADIYLDLDQPDLAIEALSGKTDRRPLVAIRLARALRRQQKLDQAQALLQPFSRGLLEDDPEVGRWVPGRGAEVALEYGLLLAARNEHEEAVSFLRASTDRSPQSAEAWRALATSLETSGDTLGSLEARERVAQIERLSGEAPATGDDVSLGADPAARQLRRARALLELGEGDQGLRVVRQEKTLAPLDPRPPLVEAQMLMSLGRRDEALAVVDAAQASFPASADVHYYRGVVQMSLEQWSAAEQSLGRAIELTPQHTPALTDMAALLIKLDRRDEARALLERVLIIAPGDATATGLLEQLQSS